MNKFDCLVYEMLPIRELTPSLNVQLDSIQAKLFAWHYIFRYYVNFCEVFLCLFVNYDFISITPNLRMASRRHRNVVRFNRLFSLAYVYLSLYL